MGYPFDLEQFQKEVFSNQLSLDQFRAVVRSGGFRSVTLRACGVHFQIEAAPRPQPGEMAAKSKVLITSRGRGGRMFRNPAGALELLWRMGVMEVNVQMRGWHPEMADKLANKRPDMAVRLRRAHEAANAEAIAKWELREAEQACTED